MISRDTKKKLTMLLSCTAIKLHSTEITRAKNETWKGTLPAIPGKTYLVKYREMLGGNVLTMYRINDVLNWPTAVRYRASHFNVLFQVEQNLVKNPISEYLMAKVDNYYVAGSRARAQD